jgi:mRNA interferase MazF
MSSGPLPARGEVWMADLGVGRGREQSGTRPVLIISEDGFNQSGAELVVAIPLTSRKKRIRTHVEILPPEGGLTVPSYIKCEDVRSISVDRLIRRMGTVSAPTLSEVEIRLRYLLGL